MIGKWVGVLAVLGFVAAAPAATKYPNKVITMVVPFTAGGPTDTVARLIAQPMSRSLKTEIIIENIAGVGGTTGANRVAKAEPNGYTLLLNHIGQATAPSLYRKLPYDPVFDFEPIGLINEVPMTIIARRDFPPGNLKELISYVKTNNVSFGDAGIGAASQLCGMLFKNAVHVELTSVPYKGTADMLKDLLVGKIDFSCDQTTNTAGQIKADKIKVYGVTTPKRLAILHKVPTVNEAGIKGFNISVWHALYAPRGTPKPAIELLTRALQESLKDREVKERFAELGAEVVNEKRATPDALRAHLKAEIEKWGAIIKKEGVHAD